jgi:hypothetical protein
MEKAADVRAFLGKDLLDLPNVEVLFPEAVDLEEWFPFRADSIQKTFDRFVMSRKPVVVTMPEKVRFPTFCELFFLR